MPSWRASWPRWEMEHSIVIGDAGFPVLLGVPCIDLAIRLGYPSFWMGFQTVASEMAIERAAIVSIAEVRRFWDLQEEAREGSKNPLTGRRGGGVDAAGRRADLLAPRGRR